MMKLFKSLHIDPVVMSLSLLFLLVFTLPLLVFPQESYEVFKTLQNEWVRPMGVVFQIMAILIFGMNVFLIFCRKSNVILWNEGQKFSNFSWATMIFCAGVATGVIYWGSLEWAYYFITTPLGLEKNSVEAIEMASVYGAFHWGIAGWGFYTIPAVAMLMVLRNNSKVNFSISAIFEHFTIFRKYPFLNKWVDVFIIVALLGSTGTSMGLGIPMVATAVAEVLGIENTFSLQLVLIVVCSVIFSVSAYLGLGKGIKKLSNLNSWLAFVFLVLIILLGPTLFILKMSVNGLGLMITQMVRMLTWTDPILQTGFVEEWTVFYWAWWLAVGPFMGLFIARISSGRSIFQVVSGTLLLGSMGSMVFFFVLGNHGINLQLSGGLDIVGMIQNNQPTEAIVQMIQSLPLGKYLLYGFCVMSIVFVATSFDSTSYVIANAASKKLTHQGKPNKWHVLFWGIILILIPLAVMGVGGLDSLKLTVIISALPMLFIYTAILYTISKFYKSL